MTLFRKFIQITFELKHKCFTYVQVKVEYRIPFKQCPEYDNIRVQRFNVTSINGLFQHVPDYTIGLFLRYTDKLNFSRGTNSNRK